MWLGGSLWIVAGARIETKTQINRLQSPGIPATDSIVEQCAIQVQPAAFSDGIATEPPPCIQMEVSVCVICKVRFLINILGAETYRIDCHFCPAGTQDLPEWLVIIARRHTA